MKKYKYIVVESSSSQENEGCWIFSTFRKAFDFVSGRYNKEYLAWEAGDCEFHSTVKGLLKDIHYQKLLESESNYEENVIEDDGHVFIDPLYYTIHDKTDEHGCWSMGSCWEIHSATEIDTI